MVIQPHAFETSNQKNGVSDVPFSSLRTDGAKAERRRGQDLRKAFERQELLEMRQARRTLLGEAMRWALFSAVPSAFFGWGIGYVLGPAFERISPGWAAPGAMASLILGAVCGALGGAAARLFYDLFEEDRDMPVVVTGVAALIVLGACIHAAGRGSVFDAVVGIAGGTPVGIASGVAVYILYSFLRVLYIWARQELNGH